MTIINTRKATLRVSRSFDRSNQWAEFFIAESKTNYYVTIKIVGYELPSCLDWKVSKKEANNMLEAATKIAKEAYINENL